MTVVSTAAILQTWPSLPGQGAIPNPSLRQLQNEHSLLQQLQYTHKKLQHKQTSYKILKLQNFKKWTYSLDAQCRIEFLNQLSSMASFGNELVSVSDAFATESSKASRKETTVNLSVKENRDYNYSRYISKGYI